MGIIFHPSLTPLHISFHFIVCEDFLKRRFVTLLRILLMLLPDVSKIQNSQNHDISNCGFRILDILLFLLWDVTFPYWHCWTDILNHKRGTWEGQKTEDSFKLIHGYFLCIYEGYFKHICRVLDFQFTQRCPGIILWSPVFRMETVELSWAPQTVWFGSASAIATPSSCRDNFKSDMIESFILQLKLSPQSSS